MTLVEIETRREIQTRFGTIAARTRRYAAPSGDGRWLLFQWLPQGRRKGRAVLIPAEWVKYGAKRLESAERRSAAQQEYEHARNVLGYGHDRSVLYVAEGLGVPLKTLRCWGFDTSRLENLERRTRGGEVAR